MPPQQNAIRRLRLNDWTEQVSLGASPSALPMAVDALLALYRRVRL